MVSLENVIKKYGNETVLKDVNIEFGETGLYFLLGKSGSGKSTLLNLIGGIIGDYFGTIAIDGENLSELTEEQWDDFRNRKIGILFQDFNLIEEKSVFENLLMTLFVSDNKESRDVIIDDALAKVGLLEFRNKLVCKLSGGQKQRVALARAIIKNQQIILADEPTGNLDSQTSNEIFSCLKKLSQEHLIIVATHDTEAAEAFGDTVFKIRDGIITEQTINETSDSRKPVSQVDIKKLSLLYALNFAKEAVAQKKKRLFFLMILMIVIGSCAFIMAGLYKYSPVNALYKRYSEMQTPILLAHKNYLYQTKLGDENDYSTDSGKDISNDFSNCFGNDNVCGVLENQYLCEKLGEVNAVVVNSQKVLNCLNIVGARPQKANEIVLSDYLVKKLGFSTSEAIGKVIGDTEETSFTIVGIFPTNYLSVLDIYGLDSNYDFVEAYFDNSCLISEEYLYAIANETFMLSVEKANPLFAQWEKKLFDNLTLYADINKPEELILYKGRMPKAENEIVISKELYEMYQDNANVDLAGNKFIDLDTNCYNGAFSDALNMAYYFPNGFEIVGIYDSLVGFDYIYPDVFVESSLFERLKKDYYESVIFDRLIVLNNFRENKSAFDYFWKNNIVWEDSQVRRVYEFTNSIGEIKQFVLILFLAMTICYLALCVLFITYSIKDQRRLIGILRSIGYRNRDIEKIYILEIIIIETCSLILITGFYWTITNYINIIAIKYYPKFTIDVFVPDYRRLITAYFIFIVVGILAVIVPLHKLSKKKIFELLHYSE